MARHRAPSDHAGLRALLAAFACIVFAAVVLHFDVAGGVTVPAWTIAVPFVVYVGLATLTLGRASLRRRAGWVVGALATHVVLVVTTAAIVAVTGSVSLAVALSEAIVESPVATVIFVASVPLTLLPFRRRALARPAVRAPRHRRAAPGAPSGEPRLGAPAAGETAFEREPQGRMPATAPGDAEGAARAESPTAAGAAPPPPPAVHAPAARPVVAPPPVRVTDEDTVRIPFMRIAPQLPAGAFVLPMERLAESMRVPHELLVPRRLVIAQLAEGRVEVAWTLVEDQFPTLGFALQPSEVRKRYPELRLSLPLELVVPQVPAALFSGGPPAAEVDDLDRYPAPFQPSLAEMPPAVPPPSPPTAVTRSVPAPPASPLIAPARPPRSAVPGLEQAVVSAPTNAPLPLATAAPAGTKRAVPVRTAGARAGAPRVADPQPAALLAQGRRLATSLAAFGPLDVAAQRMSGTTVLSLVTAELPHEAIKRAAARSAPLLSAAQQVTIHAERVSMVLMPVRGGVLVVALRAGSPLALLEILLGRACGEEPAAVMPAAALRGLAAAEVDDRVAALRGALDGFGCVVPAAFVDGASELDVYVFSAGAEPPQRAGEAARAVWHALVRESEGDLGRAVSVVLREGTRRTVVHPVRAARSVMLAAAGVLRRPGLAYRQAAAAAQRLARA